MFTPMQDNIPSVFDVYTFTQIPFVLLISKRVGIDFLPHRQIESEFNNLCNTPPIRKLKEYPGSCDHSATIFICYL